MYLFRDRETAKIFLKRALANPDNQLPHVFARDSPRSYPAAIRELQAEDTSRGIAVNEPGAMRIAESNPITAM